MIETKIPSSYAYLIYKAAWFQVRENYILALGLTISPAILSGVLSIVPLIGILAASFLSIYLFAGILVLQDRWFKRENYSVSDIGIVYKDKDLQNRILPLAIASTALSALIFLFGLLALGGTTGILISIPLTFAVVAINILLFFTLPLIIFDNLNLSQAFDQIIQATSKHILFFIMLTVMGIVLLGLAIIPLFLGLLIYIPTTFFSTYFIYLVVFKNLNLETWIASRKEPTL
ncbi:MAG: hypothetical protein J0L93_05305 [Deltaproteobacteria bacterium]|nr:hypothetical protein [Deltaproteobacteria bacterium]